MKTLESIAILGAGTIGQSIAHGLKNSHIVKNIILTSKDKNSLQRLEAEGFHILDNNSEAVKQVDTILLCVKPNDCEDLIKEIRESISENSTVISVITGKSLETLHKSFGKEMKYLIRAMPNTAIQVRESLTFLSGENQEAMAKAEAIFKQLGKTQTIKEEQMSVATVLGASAPAIYFSLLEAHMEMAIQNGFTQNDALHIAQQVMKGASILGQENKTHPSIEIGKICSPGGCTIEGVIASKRNNFAKAAYSFFHAGIQKVLQMSKNKK